MSPKIISRVFRLKGVEYYAKYLEVVNSLLPMDLSKIELSVLAHCLYRNNKGVIDKDVKVYLKEVFNFSPASLSGHLKRLSDKFVLDKNEDGFVIKDYLIPNSDFQGFQIKIENGE
nr:MAG TPA: chromosome replication initiation protein [Caudoviricetes sp.]